MEPLGSLEVRNRVEPKSWSSSGRPCQLPDAQSLGADRNLTGSLPDSLSIYSPHSSSFVGLPYRILNMNPKKELLWGLWVSPFGT